MKKESSYDMISHSPSHPSESRKKTSCGEKSEERIGDEKTVYRFIMYYLMFYQEICAINSNSPSTLRYWFKLKSTSMASYTLELSYTLEFNSQPSCTLMK